MLKRFLRWIAEKVLERELTTLYWYRVRIGEYDRWLANMPDVVRLLENLKGQCEPAGRPGTLDISGLREEMQRTRASIWVSAKDAPEVKRLINSADCMADAANTLLGALNSQIQAMERAAESQSSASILLAFCRQDRRPMLVRLADSHS
ncbi:hypothetical protein MMB19_14200 [Ralstonia insidiosa]|nr:hypothetical protein MMB19_14200 [Ralstonia insidiosa]